MSALALDPGLVHTGWCRDDGRCGTFEQREFQDDHGHLVAAYEDWLDCHLRDNPTDLLVVERAEFGRAKNADVTLALIRIAHAVAWSRNIARREFSAKQVRKWLCGTAKATDAQIKAAVNACGFFPRDEHAGDAAALLCMALGMRPEAREAA